MKIVLTHCGGIMEAVIASLEATLDSSIIQGRADCVVPVCMTAR